MAVDRSVVVRLLSNTSQFTAGMSQASGSASQLQAALQRLTAAQQAQVAAQVQQSAAVRAAAAATATQSAAVTAATARLTATRNAEAASAARVVAAERAMADARRASTGMATARANAERNLRALQESGTASASRIAAAEARLAAANRAAMVSATALRDAETRLASARQARTASAGRVAAAEAQLAAAQQAHTAAQAAQTAATQAATRAAIAQQTALASLYKKAAIGVGVLAVGIGAAVKVSSDFDAAMSSVRAQVDPATTDFNALEGAIRDAGKASVFSSTEAANAAEELAKAGLSSSQIIGGALVGSLNLAAAANISMADAATYTAQAMAMFKLDASQAGRIADVFAAGALGSTADVSTLAQALAQGGLAASQLGVSFEDTIATLSLFDQNALKGSDSGTAMKTMLTRLVPTTDSAATAMEQLGLKFFDANGQFIGMSAMAGQLQEKMGNLSPEVRTLAVNTIFGADAQRAANILIDQGASGLATYQAMMKNAGVAAAVAAQKQDNFRGDLEKAKGALEDFLITGGQGADGPLRKLTQWATNAISVFGKLPPSLVSTGTGITAIGIAGAVAIAGLLKLKSAFVTLRSEVRLSIAAMRAWSVAAGGNGSLWSGLVAKVRALGTAWQGMSTKMKVGSTLAITAILGIGTALTQSADAQENFGRSGAQLANDIAGMKNGVLDTSGLFRDLQIAMDTDKTYSFAEGLKQATGAAGGLDNAIGSVATGFGMFGTGAKSVTEATRSRLKALGQELANMQLSGDPAKISQAATAWQSLTEQAAKQGVSVETLNKLMPAYADAIARSGSNSAKSAKQVADQNAELVRQEKAAEDAKKALDDLGDTLTAQIDSEYGYAKSVRDARDSVKEHGATLNKNTDAGQANMTALLGIAKAAKQNAVAIKENGGAYNDSRAALERGRTDFLDLAKAMRMPTDQAKTLADQLFKLPDTVPVEVSIPGVDNVIKKLNDTGREVYAIKGTNVTIPVDAPNAQNIITMLAGVKGAQVSLNGSQAVINVSAPLAPDTAAKLREVKGVQVSTDGKRVTVNTSAPGAVTAANQILNVANQVRNTPPSHHTRLSADDGVTGKAQSAKRAVDNIPSVKTVTIRTLLAGNTSFSSSATKTYSRGPFSFTPDADGGIHLRGVKQAANGYLSRRDPMIAKAGSYIMWAEDETGDEAYIPLGSNKRGKAKPIAEQAVARMGGRVQWMANGGVTGSSWSPDMSGIFALISNLTYDNEKSAWDKMNEVKAAIDKSKRDVEAARRKLAEDQRRKGVKASTILADQNRINDLLAKQLTTQRQLTAAQSAYNKIKTARSLSAAQQFSSSAGTRAAVNKKFVSDLTTIEKRGFPALAHSLAEQGDDEAARVAASFASSPIGTLRSAQKALTDSSAAKASLDALLSRTTPGSAAANRQQQLEANANALALRAANGQFANQSAVNVNAIVDTNAIVNGLAKQIRVQVLPGQTVVQLDSSTIATATTQHQATQASYGTTAPGVNL